MSADRYEIVGDHSPSNAARKPVSAVVQTAVQAKASFEDRYPSFNAVVPAPPPSKPALFSVLFAGFRLIASFGEHNPSNLPVFGDLFVFFRKHASIGTGLGGWLAEPFSMAIQARGPL